MTSWGIINEQRDERAYREARAKKLAILRSRPLIQKILISQYKVREWAWEWGWDKVYVAFSGGKDSTVLLHIARSIARDYGEDIPAVFCDTGLEYPEVRDFVKTVDNVTWIKPKMTFRAVTEKYGFPVISKEVSRVIAGARKGWPSYLSKMEGRHTQTGETNDYMSSRFGKWKWLMETDIPISDRCCDILKKAPFHRYVAETGRKPIIGTMASESSARMAAFLRRPCNAFDATEPTSNPIWFWTDHDILRYIEWYRLAIPSVYGEILRDGKKQTQKFLDEELRIMDVRFDPRQRTVTGVRRTGCMFCMYGVQCEKSPNRFEQMKESHPKHYDYCINKLGCGKVLKTIGVNF